MRLRRILKGVLLCSFVLTIVYWMRKTSNENTREEKTTRKESRPRDHKALSTAAALSTSSSVNTRGVGVGHLTVAIDRAHSPTQSAREGKVAVVTGFSENHVNESVDMIASVQRYSPASPIIVYDLGISTASLQMLRSFCNVRVHTFPFHLYPSHLRNLEACAWKPFIVQEVLKEYPTVFYADASVRLKQDLANMLQLLDTVSPVIGQSTAPSGPAGSFTHNVTLAYFNISRDQYRDVAMFAATYFLIKRMPIVEKMVMHQWVQCAMDANCISPPGSKKWPCLTELQKKDSNAFIGCHRYDQSALSIVLFKAFGRIHYNKCIQESVTRAIVRIARYKTTFNKVRICQT